MRIPVSGGKARSINIDALDFNFKLQESNEHGIRFMRPSTIREDSGIRFNFGVENRESPTTGIKFKEIVWGKDCLFNC